MNITPVYDIYEIVVSSDVTGKGRDGYLVIGSEFVNLERVTFSEMDFETAQSRLKDYGKSNAVWVPGEELTCKGFLVQAVGVRYTHI